MPSTDRRFPFRTAGVGMLIAAAGWAWTNLANDMCGPSLLGSGVALLAGTIWYRFRASGSNAVIGRWDAKNRRNAWVGWSGRRAEPNLCERIFADPDAAQLDNLLKVRSSDAASGETIEMLLQRPRAGRTR